MTHANPSFFFFFFNDTATTEIYTLSLHDALPIWRRRSSCCTFVRSLQEKTSCWRRTCASRNLCRMFTGIVRELGTVEAFDGSRLVVAAPETAAAATVGDSVAVAGVCLTVVANEDGRLAFDAVPETLSRTALGTL